MIPMLGCFDQKNVSKKILELVQDKFLLSKCFAKKKLLKSQFFKSGNVFIRHVGQTLLLVKNVNAKMLKKKLFC